MNVTRYTALITTVDPTNGVVGFVTKADAQERRATVLTTQVASRWPIEGEIWLVRQENGTWYVDSPLPTPTYATVTPGDAVINSPTGTVHVIGNVAGTTDFAFSQSTFVRPGDTITLQPGDLLPSATTTRIGCLLCNGSPFDPTVYTSLSTAIGHTYGTDGTTGHPLVPDLRGRVPMGAGTGTATNATSWSLGNQPTGVGVIGGEQTHALSGAESGQKAGTYTVTDTDGAVSAYGSFSPTGSGIGYWQKNQAGTTRQVVIPASGAGTAHSLVQPVSVINWFIKT